MKTALFCRIIVLWPALSAMFLLQAASTIQFSATTYPVAENSGPATLTVQRSNDVDSLVSVDYACADGTATNGLKYTAVSGILAFGAGETNKNIAVPILNDGLVGGTTTFQVTLSNPSSGTVLGARTNATVRIADNDTGLQFEFAAYSAAEDAGSALVGVVRGDDGNFPVTVDLGTTNATATAGTDYEETSGTLRLAAGEKVQLFTVLILNDSLKEPNRAFRLVLSNPTGGSVLGSQKTATVTIVDNDSGVQLEFSQYWIQENEGALTVKVLRGNDVDLPPFTVDYATTNLTATAGQDYVETRGTLTFTAGETVKTITVPITDDGQSEADEKFTLTLSNPSAGLSLGPIAKVTITILDTTGIEGHEFGGIGASEDGNIQLTMAGRVSKRFLPYYDLYPLEFSTNLKVWTPWVTLQQTNSSTNALTFTDREAADSDRRFYRTATSHRITPFTKPTGPFAVGVQSRLVTDPSRRNRYDVSTNGSFMVSVWYPAVPESGKVPSRYVEAGLDRDLDRPAFMDRLPYFVTHALPDALCAPDHASYPIVLFSPGWTAIRSQAAEKGPELASHGYVVVGVDHWDALGTVFPDGTHLHSPANVDITVARFQDRVRDLILVVDELARWNSSDTLFAGRLDVTNVAAMGFSWGGEVAPEVCRIDTRVRVAVMLDSYPSVAPVSAYDLIALGLSKPFIGMYSEGGGDSTLFNKATRDAIFFTITGSQHLNFGDYYWISFPGDLAGGRDIARTINAYTLWFLNKYLKGLDEPMPTKADYPRVTGFRLR